MSIVNHRTGPVGLALIGLITACATSGPPPAALPANLPQNAFQADTRAKATPDEIATAQRSDPLTRATFWSQEYQKDTRDLDTAVSFLKALRTIRSYDRLADIGRTTLALHPEAYEVYLELGRSLMDQGRPAEAVPLLARSADFAPPQTATPLAVLGLAFDQLDRHHRAQDAYQIALERDPQRATTWTNYGLSLALTGDLVGAEHALRTALALPGANNQVRQNLVLILGLQGKTQDIRDIDPFAQPDQLQSNLEALSAMRAMSPTPASAPVPDRMAPQAPERSATEGMAQSRLTLRPKLRLAEED